MPNFPTYRGELPPVLSPFNLRHYLLLTYWIFARPTALKSYLYQAAPEHYRFNPDKRGFTEGWTVRAYRCLYVMVPLVGAVLSVLTIMLIALITGWFQGSPVGWLHLGAGFITVAAGGVVFAGTVGRVAGGPIGGLSGGVIGAGGGAALGLGIGGLAVAVLGGVVGGVIGAAVGWVFGTGFGGVGGLASGVVVGVVVGVAGAIAIGLASDIRVGVVIAIASLLCTFQALSYPLEAIQSWRSARSDNQHPFEWHEVLVLPVPGTVRALLWRLQQSEPAGMRLVADAVGNPFQRWAAQRALHYYLHRQTAPLHFLYTLLENPDFNMYAFAPVNKLDWERIPSIRRVLLGELNGQWVDMHLPGEPLIWRLTYAFRELRQTPLTHFAAVMCRMLNEESVADFDLSACQEIYRGVRDDYLGGEEIAATFEALAHCCDYTDLKQLPETITLAERLPRPESPIRPGVLEALARLGIIGAEVRRYQDASSRVNRLAALSRATDALDRLEEYITTQVLTPEQAILRRIIMQWRRLISEAGGMVGRAALPGPVANPYVAGNPVEGDLFVGREDVLRRLEELWAGDGQRPSVVLYGHRRMGKSSILHNLGHGARFGAHTLVVDFNMQRVGLVANTGELLYNLALALYDSLDMAVQRTLGEPAADRFSDANPYTTFDRFLKQLDHARGEQRLIVAVDEFELIEQQIDQERLEKQLLSFWRGVIQTYPWFVMAFAGLHTLQEMREDYWNPLFGSVTAIEVSFLPRAAAERLITQPSPDFDIDYEPAAIEQVIELTNGQPYLIQLIGHALVTRFNRQMVEHAGFAVSLGGPVVVTPERRFTAADIDAVIDSPEFYRDGDAYFTGVWRQAEADSTPHQSTIMRVLAHSKHGLGEQELTVAARLGVNETRGALTALQRHDVLAQSGDQWCFTVELMRRWVARREASR